MGVLCLFHSLAKVDLPPFVDDFHLEIEVTLDQKAFVYALACFFSGDHSGMVYELL
jgi:hypothetical protein